MKKMRLFGGVGMAFYGVLFAATASPKVSEDVAARVLEMPTSHPRLFFTDEETPVAKAKIASDTLLSGVYGRLKNAAEVIVELAPVKREKVGKRLLGVSRTCLQRVSYLAFAYRMTKEERYLQRAEREMRAAAAFEDWNPGHFLDVAEMTAALAIGYDWLYDGLGSEARGVIREAIVKKGLEPSLAGGGWVTTSNNWNQVCHGGLVLGALAVFEDSAELSRQIIVRAIENVPRAMAEYAPDGVYPEGPSYWQYGTTYNLLMISALESALGSDIGLTSAEGFLKTPEFYLHATGPTGLYFNFSDCGARGGLAEAMYWFARRRQDPALLWREKMELELFAAETPEPGGGGDRMLPFLLLWAQPLEGVRAPETLCWKGDGRTPVAMLRTGWRNDATYVGFKGGSPGTNHAHMDTGSFVVDMKGVRWAIDLGSQSYHGLESQGVDLWNRRQESERWTVFRLNNYSHNTLVVDGQLQRVAGNGAITRFSGDRAHPFAVVDMSSVYEGQLRRALRGIRLDGASVLVQDEITTLDHASSVRWAMATNAAVTLAGDTTATLAQDGQTVSLRVLSPATAKLAVYDIEKPAQDYDEVNPNTRMIGFERSVASSTTEKWCVLLEPDAAREAPSDFIALENW